MVRNGSYKFSGGDRKYQKSKWFGFSRYFSFIENKKACVNIKNTDDACIKYCLLANDHYDELTGKRNLPQSYKKWDNEFILPSGVSFPIDILKDIPKISKENNVKINVFHYQDGNKLDILYNDRSKNNKVCDLLLLSEGDKNHFVLIRDISKLLNSENKNEHKMYWCRNCLKSAYTSQEKLNKHIEICNKNESVRCVLPDEDNNILSFNNTGNSFNHPFCVFLDFESTLETFVDDSKCDTVKYQKHIPNSCGMKYKCIHDMYSEDRVIFNSNDSDTLLEQTILKLEEYALKSYNLTQQNKIDYKFKSDKERILCYSSKTCNECYCEFSTDNKKVVHHDHITGYYISTLCNNCNLKYKYKKFLPVYIHNLKGYDRKKQDPYLILASLVIKKTIIVVNLSLASMKKYTFHFLKKLRSMKWKFGIQTKK